MFAKEGMAYCGGGGEGRERVWEGFFCSIRCRLLSGGIVGLGLIQYGNSSTFVSYVKYLDLGKTLRKGDVVYFKGEAGAL